MAGNGEEKGRGFTIIDRRGTRPDEEPAAEEPNRVGEPADETTGSAAGPSPSELPEVDFASFLLSLGTSALYHLGQVPDPESGEPSEPNLPVARHTIDTLELLERKTQGNLTAEEAALLRNLLTDLRMRYIEASR